MSQDMEAVFFSLFQEAEMLPVFYLLCSLYLDGDVM